MRTFDVVPGSPAGWAGMSDAERVVTTFLATVRVTGDAGAAARVMGPDVACHQVVSEEPLTIRRTPEEYADHVRDMISALSDLTFRVEDLISCEDRVYVRWRQEGRHTGPWEDVPASGRPLVEVGSATYRVAGGRIVEYWVQLDREGFARQVTRNAASAVPPPVSPAPTANGGSLPLRPSVRAGDWLVVSGQVGALHGELVPGGVGGQVTQALTNLEHELDCAGADLGSVVKTTVFLTTLSHYEEMNINYAAFFPGQAPARTAIAVAALPGGALVEVEAWAWQGPS